VLGIHRRTGLTPGEFAESFLEYRRTLSAHDYRGTRVASSLDSTLNNTLYGVEAGAGHADFCR